MNTAELDRLRFTYKGATDEWIEVSRQEEVLATADHSMTAMENWDDAHFKEQSV